MPASAVKNPVDAPRTLNFLKTTRHASVVLHCATKINIVTAISAMPEEAMTAMATIRMGRRMQQNALSKMEVNQRPGTKIPQSMQRDANVVQLQKNVLRGMFAMLIKAHVYVMYTRERSLVLQRQGT